MRTLLVAGSFHSILQPYLSTILNAKALRSEDVDAFLTETASSVDLILYTDDGIGNQLCFFAENLQKTLEFFKARGKEPRIVVATCNGEVRKLALPAQVEVRFYFGKRVAFCEYKSIEAVFSNMISESEPEPKQKNNAWWKRVFLNEERKTSAPSNLSQSISRVIAVTGCRGSGVTSTVANLAETAIKEGLTVIVIDLDFLLRGMNMYFGSLLNTENEDLNNSLIRLLAKPQNYDNYAYQVKPGFYLSTLPYTFLDTHLEERFITEEKIITMISILKNKFNLCILDLPLEIAAAYKGILLHIDTFGLCVNNCLYSILNTARNLEVCLPDEYKNMLIAKSKVIVTRYNDKIVAKGENFTPGRVCETLKMVSADFEIMGEPAGYVPYSDDYDTQIEIEVPVVNSSELMKEAYKKILIRVLEGVG